MIRSISSRWWYGLLGLAWFGINTEVQAWDNPLVKVSNVRFNIHVEMSTTPTAPRPIAPWYAYFPADPRMLPSPQASPYPPWPMQFPPSGPPADAFKDAQKRPGAAMSSLQSVGYVPAQAPSYWYQGR
jgi:hypothetical protein